MTNFRMVDDISNFECIIVMYQYELDIDICHSQFGIRHSKFDTRNSKFDILYALLCRR